MKNATPIFRNSSAGVYFARFEITRTVRGWSGEITLSLRTKSRSRAKQRCELIAVALHTAAEASLKDPFS